MCLIFFVVIFLIQSSGIFLTGIVGTFFSSLIPKLDFIVVFLIAAALINIICGVLTFFINNCLFHLIKSKVILLILLCSSLLLLSIFLAIGTMKIFPRMGNMFQKFWLWIFHAKSDPIGILVLMAIDIPCLFIFIPFSYFIMDEIRERCL